MYIICSMGYRVCREYSTAVDLPLLVVECAMALVLDIIGQRFTRLSSDVFAPLEIVIQVHWVFATVHTLLCTLFCYRSYQNFIQVYLEFFLHTQANIRNCILYTFCQIIFVWTVTFYYFILQTKCLSAITNDQCICVSSSCWMMHGYYTNKFIIISYRRSRLFSAKCKSIIPIMPSILFD